MRKEDFNRTTTETPLTLTASYPRTVRAAQPGGYYLLFVPARLLLQQQMDLFDLLREKSGFPPAICVFRLICAAGNRLLNISQQHRENKLESVQVDQLKRAASYMFRQVVLRAADLLTPKYKPAAVEN